MSDIELCLMIIIISMLAFGVLMIIGKIIFTIFDFSLYLATGKCFKLDN